MKLKERKEGNFFYYLKKSLKFISRGIFNKKTKIIFWILILIVLFSMGTLFGLLISGFFGTFDEPSQRVIDLLHSKGIIGLKNIKRQMEGVISENFKIPINYIAGQFSKPKKIFIDIGLDNYKRIEYKREQALDIGVLVTSGEDYVPAEIRYKDQVVNVNLRLKGDWVDHLEGDKWSFRIKTKGDTLFGMKTFSIQDPKTRNYLNEWLYHQALEREDVLSLKYDFVEVVINGENKGIYALEEHFEKQLIERNNRREGLIIKFNEDPMWDEIVKINNYYTHPLELISALDNKSLDWFYSSSIETFTNEKSLKDPYLAKQFEEASSLLESFRRGSLGVSEVFDTDKLAKYFAINTLMGTGHASTWNNIRFYYNPITSRLEPIGFDANCDVEAPYNVIGDYIPPCLSNENNCSQKIESFSDLFLRDKEFFEKYMKELDKFSQKSYLDSLFLDLGDDLEKNLNIIHKNYPFYCFSIQSFYERQKRIREGLTPLKSINAYFQKSLPSQNELVLYIGNVKFIPLEIENLVYNDSVIFHLIEGDKLLQPKIASEPVDYQKFNFKIPAGFSWNDSFASDLKINYKILGIEGIKEEIVSPWSYVEENFLEEDFIRQETNISSFELLIIEEDTKSIFIQKGSWILNQSMTIPPGFSVYCNEGTSINLMNGATILSYSDLQFSGSDENPIKIFSSDRTGQGLTLLNVERVSNLKHVIFNDLTSPIKKGWELSGAINFYKSPVKLENIIIKDINSEDGLNIIDSEFEIRDSHFENCISDCFDGDFVEGPIKSSSFIGCGNDGLDFSGSFVDIENIDILNVGDKGISVGEDSNVTIENAKINGDKLNKGYIGIASKDKSQVFIKNSEISNVEYGLAVYEKKSEFGAASINAININFSNINNSYIIEKESSLLIDDVMMLNKEEEVYKKLYEL